MSKNNVALWIKELRSGDYEQGTEFLHGMDTEGRSYYCCLGVACHLYERETGKIISADKPEQDCDRVMSKCYDTYVYYDNKTDVLPEVVREWLGIRTEIGEFVNADGNLRSLAMLNDNGFSFRAIADVIESRPDKMFPEVDGK